MKRVAVIGAGWAGLAAAVSLTRRGVAVTLFEAGREAGGRARSLPENGGFSFLDNGQHLLIGAYRRVLALMDTVNAPRHALRRLPLEWYLQDGMRWHARALPAPFHLLAGVLAARGITWRDKTALLRQMAVLKRRPPPAQSVADWLRGQNASAALVCQFWQPLVYAALNTPLEHADIRVLAVVLADGVWQGKRDADFLIPQCGLGELLAQPALAWLQQHGAVYRPSCRVPRLLPENGGVRVSDEIFDAAVAAVAPYHAPALLPLPPEMENWFAELRHHAITTVYLRYPCRVRLPAPMTGLAAGTAHWLFARADECEVAAVVSVSEQHGCTDAADWAARVHADLLRVCPDLPPPAAQRVITEKRATAAATGRALPDCAALNAQGLFLAGDYWHARYPATLEAAVQSGEAAADAVCSYLEKQ